MSFFFHSAPVASPPSPQQDSHSLFSPLEIHADPIETLSLRPASVQHTVETPEIWVLFVMFEPVSRPLSFIALGQRLFSKSRSKTIE